MHHAKTTVKGLLQGIGTGFAVVYSGIKHNAGALLEEANTLDFYRRTWLGSVENSSIS
jgi:hypothetical protein